MDITITKMVDMESLGQRLNTSGRLEVALMRVLILVEDTSVAKVALVVEKAAKVDMEVAVPSLGNYPVVTMEISR